MAKTTAAIPPMLKSSRRDAPDAAAVGIDDDAVDVELGFASTAVDDRTTTVLRWVVEVVLRGVLYPNEHMMMHIVF
jgi:hypothetical protein